MSNIDAKIAILRTKIEQTLEKKCRTCVNQHCNACLVDTKLEQMISKLNEYRNIRIMTNQQR